MPKRTKKTAAELREEAAQLIKQAEKQEEERATAIGRTVMKLELKEFSGFDLETFKKEVAAL